MKTREAVSQQAGLAVEANGVRIGVRVDDACLLDAVTKRLPHGWRPIDSSDVDEFFSLLALESPEGTTYRVCRHATELDPPTSLDNALESLESHLQIHVAERAVDRVFVHAGVVGWRGRAIVLPGRSFAGKTTLVSELLRAGATYYSDEYAVLDPQGLVHPFTRPLAIRTGSPNRQRVQLKVPPHRAGDEPLPVGLIVLTSYRRRARWRPERLSPGRALLEVLNHAVPARRKPAIVLDTLEQIVTRTPVVKSLRGDARRVVPTILNTAEWYS